MAENAIRHVGVIMDGNRRWARLRGLPTLEGHTKGAWNLFYLCDWCRARNIPEVSVYVFSTYNWNRTQEEIDGLFGLVERIFLEKLQDCVEKGIQIQLMGDLRRLPPSLQQVLRLFRDRTSGGRGVKLNIAINYGGQEDIVEAVRRYCLAGGNPSDLTREALAEHLDCSTPMDLVIRSGGYQRLSNFMIWQAACAEFFFTDVLWPDFTEENFDQALSFYRQTTINNGK